MSHRYDNELLLPWEQPHHHRFVSQRYPSEEVPFVEFFDGGHVSRGLTPAVFDQLMSLNVPTKSPGSPLCYLVSTNSGLETYRHEIYDILNARLTRLWQIGRELFANPLAARFYPTDYVSVSKHLVQSNIIDPVLVNFKGEPRAMDNGVPKRPRLVSQISVMVNMIQRLVFGPHLSREQQSTSENLPVAVALDLSTEDIRQQKFSLFKKFAPLSSSDVQGYEYSVNRWLRYLHACKASWCMRLCDRNMVPYPGKEQHFYVLWGLVYCLNHKVVQTQEGQLVVPPPGSMSSGELITFSENSHDRSWLSYYVAIKAGLNADAMFIHSAGDDNLDSSCKQLSDYYADLGFVITDFEIQSDIFTFCSTTFKQDGCYGNNIAKYVYAAIHSKRKVDYQMQVEFRMLYQHHPEYQLYWDLLLSKLSSTLSDVE